MIQNSYDTVAVLPNGMKIVYDRNNVLTAPKDTRIQISKPVVIENDKCYSLYSITIEPSNILFTANLSDRNIMAEDVIKNLSEVPFI